MPPEAPPLPKTPDIYDKQLKPETEPKADEPDDPGADTKSDTQEENDTPKGGKDLTVRSESDRAEMLEELFANLKAAPNAEDADMIAEEVWAVMLQSGSASVDMLLMRGIAAQALGDNRLARRMFDHVTRLQPEFAEGWSRSARLALEEKDYQRAANETLKTLSLEPRHFYALWTLGNILETLNKPLQAFEAYSDAHDIYPLHGDIKARVDALRQQAEGQAL